VDRVRKPGQEKAVVHGRITRGAYTILLNPKVLYTIPHSPASPQKIKSGTTNSHNLAEGGRERETRERRG